MRIDKSRTLSIVSITISCLALILSAGALFVSAQGAQDDTKVLNAAGVAPEQSSSQFDGVGSSSGEDDGDLVDSADLRAEFSDSNGIGGSWLFAVRGARVFDEKIIVKYEVTNQGDDPSHYYSVIALELYQDGIQLEEDATSTYQDNPSGSSSLVRLQQ